MVLKEGFIFFIFIYNICFITLSYLLMEMDAVDKVSTNRASWFIFHVQQIHIRINVSHSTISGQSILFLICLLTSHLYLFMDLLVVVRLIDIKYMSVAKVLYHTPRWT